MHRSAGRRGHETDASRQKRDLALAVIFEETFEAKPLLELVEMELKLADSGWLQVLANQLVGATRLVDTDAARDNHLLPVLEPKPQASRTPRQTTQGS